jgi:hypothetical protein
VLTVTGSGIKASSGVVVSNDATIAWTHAPVIQAVNVEPDNIWYPKTVIGFQVSAAIDLSSLTWGDLEITRDGGSNLATSAITFARTSPTSLWYTITIPSTLTQASGAYQIKINGAAFTETTGEAFANTGSGVWDQMYVLAQINQFPTAAVGPKTAVGFQSSVEMDLASMTWADVEVGMKKG